MAYREPTLLEKLTRDHNWHMGRLRRIYVAVDICKDPDNREAAKLAIDAEMQAEVQRYKEVRQKLLDMRNFI